MLFYHSDRSLAGPRPAVMPRAAQNYLPNEYAPLDEVIDQLADATITAAGSQQHERAAWLRELEGKLRVVRRRLAA